MAQAELKSLTDMNDMMRDFLNAAFWRSSDTHVALAPGQTEPDLRAAVEAVIGRNGWCLFQTSGSEGRKKWVALTKAQLLVSADAVNTHHELTAGDHWLLALPVHHVGGFGILARAHLSGARVTAFAQKWDPAMFCRLCDEQNATLTSLVPTQVFDLVAARLTAPASMRVVMVGGGAISGELERAARELGWPLRRTYGMTETASQVAAQRDHDEEMDVLPIWELQIEADERLRVRGPALAQGWMERQNTGWQWHAISRDEGLKTRDRVTLRRANGRQWLRFIAREAEVVKICGELVALEPIRQRLEALLLAMGLPPTAAVVCDLPDERKEARLVLVFSRIDADLATQLQNRLNAGLRPLERIGEVREVAQIPRSALGKVLWIELRSLL